MKIAIIVLDAFPVNCVFCMKDIWPSKSPCVSFFEGELVDPDIAEEWAGGWACPECYLEKSSNENPTYRSY